MEFSRLQKFHNKLIRRLMARHQKDRYIAPHMMWHGEEFYMQAHDKYRHIAGIPDTRCYFLQSCLRSLANVPGDVAECGVRKGKSALYMNHVIEGNRNLYLFDSFEGLSDPNPEKDDRKTIYRAAGRKRRIFHNENLDEVMDRFAEHSNIHVLQGWIPDRFAEVADRTFCLAHVDVDMYDPTYQAYEFFYERLAPGGMLICDDYGSAGYPGARRAVNEFFADKPETPIEVPQGQAFIIKQ